MSDGKSQVSSSSGGGGIAVILIVLAIIMVIAIYFAYIYRDSITKVITGSGTTKKSVPTYTITVKAYDEQKKLIAANYVLLENGNQKYTGILSPDKVEVISGLSNSSIYSLKLSLDGYYPARADCVIDSTCSSTLVKKGEVSLDIAQLSPVFSRGLLFIQDGTVKYPVICIAWKNMVEVSTSLENIPVTAARASEYDSCYVVGDKLVSTLFEFNITKNRGDFTGSWYKVTFFDDCGLESCISPITKEVTI